MGVMVIVGVSVRVRVKVRVRVRHLRPAGRDMGRWLMVWPPSRQRETASHN